MARPGEVVSHWHHFVEDFNTSSLDFYRNVEDALTKKESPVRPSRIDWSESGILSAKREYLRATYNRYSFDIAAFPFGHDYFFSWWLTKRRPEGALLMACGTMVILFGVLALLIKLAGYIFGALLFIVAVSAAWNVLKSGAIAGAELVDDIMLAMPIWGSIYSRFFRPQTYFSEDTRIIFQEAVHAVVLHQIESVLAAKGAKALAREAATPYSWPPMRSNAPDPNPRGV
jgi:hypothetical protein